MARQFLAAAFFALSAFKLGWLVVAPIFLAAEQRRSDAAEADLRRVCRARQPPWALWRRERLAAECSARALAELRGTQSFPPPSLVLKHQDFPSVLSTHHLGAAVWCGAGIAQFALRRNSAAERQRHRLVGRLHLLGVALLTAGFVQICRHDLHFDRDFRAAYADVPARDEREHRLGVLVLCGLQAWFVLTAGKAWAAARARRIDAHSAWMPQRRRNVCTGR
ncbi:hypothetical protein KFE25_008101 [Diacronema lutheri]|uniref:Uncharacterized protein n=1 Tax=Diacronema lutheri TaxID=2081491 RepID=A0A8J5XN59_DIALT|nr:hypothetical protein KFE25_008101 [Diacronema lutheri]